MANNDKLIFPIGFDLEEGIAQVEKDWGTMQRRLQKTIDGKPLTIKVDTKGVKQFETYSENMRNSINKIRESMKELDETWNSMSDFDKFDKNGNLTSGAQELVQKYNELTVALQTYGKTLGNIASDAKRQAEEEVKALERKEQAQIKANRAAYNAQVRAGQQALAEQEKNRADYEKLVADYAKLEQAEARLTQRGLQYEQERIRLKQQSQQASDNEYENLVRQIKAEQQLAANKANQAKQSSYNTTRKQGLERLRILNAEENSIEAINRKLQIQQQRLQSADIGSAKFQKIAAEVKRLTDELDKANARIAELTGNVTEGATRQKGAVEETNAAYETQSSYLSRLFQRMVAYASVAQAVSFIRNIKEVTAEFELQRVALGALIQDAYKANAIFEQIKVQAVKSPYEVKDLVTYTKQLAAYGVKADDLIGTMNKLADISAGLGTDMNRIILAYGQIQAAGVLKGTELRQLTELGLPMVDLLAEYYSTLRNEVVTTSEVFDMISKKEVPFEAVKTILDDLTSEGGRFYEMQAIQAETLAGQWSNMKDTLSIMFDEMGRSEEVRALLTGWIDAVKYLALNWEQVWKAIKLVGGTYGVLKVATLLTNQLRHSQDALEKGTRRVARIQNLWSVSLNKTKTAIVSTMMYVKTSASAWGLFRGAINLSVKAVQSLLKSLVALVVANPVSWITAAVGAIAAYKLKTSEARNEMDAFNDRMRESAQEAAQYTGLMTSRFDQLAKEVVNSADGSDKQIKALRRLKQQFGEMFPDYKLTVEYLREMAQNATDSADAFGAMKTNIKAFMGEKMRQQFVENYYNKLQQQYAKAFTDLTDTTSHNWSELLGFVVDKAMEGDIDTALDKIFEEWKKKYNSPNANYNLSSIYDTKSLDEAISKSNELLKTWGGMGEGGKNLRKATGLFDMNQILLITRAFSQIDSNVDSMMKNFDNLNPELKEVNAKLKKLDESIKNTSENTGVHDALLWDDLKDPYTDYLNERISESELIDMIINKQLEKDFKKFIQEISKLSEGGAKTLYDALQKMSVEELAKQVAKGTIEIEDAYGHLKNELSNTEVFGLQELTKRMKIFDSTWKRDLDSMTGYIADGSKKVAVYSVDQIKSFNTLSDALKTASDDYKKLKNDADRLAKVKASGGVTDPEEMRKLNTDIEEADFKLKGLYNFLKKYGALDLIKSDDKTKKSAEQALKDELAAVEKIYKRYQDLRKLKSETDTQSILANEFKGVSLTTLSKAYSPTQMIEVYQKALAEAQRLGKKDLVLEIQTKIGEFNVAEEQRKLEKNLKRLSDDLSRTKTAKEFFDRMLGLTGDKQLSATLTMSVYGDDADVMGVLLAQQTANAFKKKYKDIDFSDVAISDKGIFDWETILMEGTEQFDKFGEQGWLDFLKDVDEGRKASAKRLETLMNELEKTKTYSEKLVDIYTNTQERLNTIDQEVKDDAVRKRLKEQAKEWQTKEMQKLQYESFKDSPMYVAMFENLDATSTAMLTNMRNHIVKLQSEWQKLDPTQLKELQSRINEIDKQLATRNPFKSIVDGIKEFNALQKSGSRKGDEQALFEATQKRLEAQQKYDQAVASKKPETEIQNLAKALQTCVDNEKKAAEQMTKWDNATQKVMQGMQNLEQVTQLVQTTTTAVNDIVEAFGGFGDAADEEFWNTILDGINGFLSGVQSAGTGVAQIMAGDILGGVTSLASGIGSIVSSIGNLIYAGRIKRAEKEIERQQELLDNLAYSYERLEKAQEKAFGSDYISNYEQRLANLQAQQEAYLAQADAERSKGKKADADKIKEYEEQARATADAIKDMQSELSEYFLGTDLTSAARDFANAWIDAYKEFGSTTDAMKEKFQEMIQNMIVESFAAKVIQSALSDIFTEIDNMTKDGVLDMSEASKIADMTEVAVSNIDVGMNNLMNALSQAGISVRGMGSELTGISRDIATASEESILGLAAGINTQNFYISQVPTKLDTIIGLLRGENAMQGSAITLQDLVTIQNQHLSYLPSIAQHTAETVAECKQIVAETRRTADALERVIKPRGTQATHTVNTSL